MFLVRFFNQKISSLFSIALLLFITSSSVYAQCDDDGQIEDSQNPSICCNPVDFNSTLNVCLPVSANTAVYMFSSVTLDDVDGSYVYAVNSESGRIVGYGEVGNAGSGYTEVSVYGLTYVNGNPVESSVGYMNSGDTPQFYVADASGSYLAHTEAADGTILQNINPFYANSMNITSLDLVSDCNGDIGGAASFDSECQVCWGGNTGIDFPECDSLIGDVNEDGLLNVLDVVIAANIVISDGYNELADMNQDGSLNVLDLVILVNLIINP